MNNMHRKLVMPILLIAVLFIFNGCNESQKSGLSEDEAAELAAIAGVSAEDFTDISGEAITKERAEKFEAVSAMARTESGLYGFIMRPIGYNGPVTLALVIDGESGKSLGLKILHHEETEHYVRDMENDWFTGRFSNKSAAQYLQVVKVEAKNEYDIVSITGATVTTEGIVGGVNAAFGLFREYVWNQEADDGPPETGSIAIRAYGVIIGHITLDEIKELPSVRRTMSIHSSAGVTRHDFRGTLLSNALDLFSSDITKDYTGLLTVGADGYMSPITMDEVLMENNVYIMYEDNGEPLPKRNGQPGAMRVVALDDMFGERFTNYLIEFILED